MSFFRPIAPLARGWVFSFACCAALASAIAWQISASFSAPWSAVFLMVSRDWFAWAVLIPLLVRLVNRLPIERANWRISVPVHVGVCLAVIVGMGLLAFAGGPRRVMMRSADKSRSERVEPPPMPRRGMAFVGWVTFGPHLPIYLAILGVAHAAYFYRGARDRERRSLELTALLAESRLQALRAQIQPHFLFNALNALGGLIRTNPEAADDMLVALCDFLRRTLADSREQEVPLGRELEDVRSYLAIEKIRFGDRLTFSIDAQPDLLVGRVPALLLQPLVENAIRHGIAPRAAAGQVDISVKRNGDMLGIVVRDDGVGLREDPPPEGLGLSNCRARLAELHGDAASLRIVAGTGTTVEIELPWRT